MSTRSLSGYINSRPGFTISGTCRFGRGAGVISTPKVSASGGQDTKTKIGVALPRITVTAQNICVGSSRHFSIPKIFSDLFNVTSKKRVLIVCTGNSCRSQMAQALWNDLGGSEWVAESAGSNPAGFIHPLAIQALREIGLSTDGLTSKSTGEFLDQEIDLAVTVCDHAKENCPVFPGAKEVLHWPFDDPAQAAGSDEHKMKFFRRVREEIKTKINSYLN